MAIDRKKVIEEMSKVTLVGNEHGLIPVFNVYIQQLPAEFWNGFARRILASVPADLVEITEGLLVDAAHECGYHTGHGILTSEEWKGVLSPMIEKEPEDTLHGLFAVFSAWGWANAEIVELIPKQKMVVRAYDYYEADIVLYGVIKRPAAYMIRGVAAAFMDLCYGDRPYPEGIKTFKGAQTKGIEIGDPWGEFEVTRF
jgi:hypothetical protein